MKKLLAFVALIALTGCSDDGKRPSGPVVDDAGKLMIYAMNYPLAYFTARIASSDAEVNMPVPADQDPAYWSPGYEDVLKMQEADLIVLNGASYESWIENISLSRRKLVVTTGGLEGALIPLEATTTHSHGAEGEHEHSGTAFTTWLDPLLAAEQARVIARALAARRPQRTDHFEERLAELVEQLNALDDEMAQAIGGKANLPVLFSHPVYQYLVRRHGLNARNVHWEPGQMPDEAAWNELRKIRETHPAGWMIWEKMPLPEIRAQLESSGIRSVVFDPCPNAPSDGDFLSVMTKNLEALRLVYGAE